MSRRIKFMLSTVVVLCITFWASAKVEAAARIHYIALKGSTDAILLEDNGRFGIVDSGEDWDYPQGDDLKYPYRTGIVTDQGFEQQVIYYMKSVGVTSSNLDFYIGTHAHSDHIGSGDEIVNYFKPKKLYLKKYSDSNLSATNKRWDNSYIYNGLLAAARDNRVTVVQNLTEGMQIKLGSQMKLTLYNTVVRKKIPDENSNSLIIKVNACGRTTVLTGDAVPEVVRWLLNNKKLGSTDILKLPHHGYRQNNPDDILKKFAPGTAVVTGPVSNMDSGTQNLLRSMGTDVKSTCSTSQAAIVSQFTAAGYTCSAKSVKGGWFTYDGGRYYMDTAGRPAVGWKKISGKWYYFDKTGKAKTGWIKYKGNYYFLNRKDTAYYRQGAMLTDWKVIDGKTYYFKKDSGEMLTGWQTIGGKTFYLKESGAGGDCGQVMKGWQVYKGRTYYLQMAGEKGTAGRMLTGWLNIGGKMFYLNRTGNVSWTKGMLLTGWQTIGGKSYYLNPSGTAGVRGCAAVGWLMLNGKTYYLNPSGEAGVKGTLLTGWQTVGNEQYYFIKGGTVGGIRGKMLLGWQTIGAHEYYLEPSGTAGVLGKAAKGFRTIDGNTYYFQVGGGPGAAGRQIKGSIQTWDDYVYTFHSQTGALFDITGVTTDVSSSGAQEQSMLQYNAVKSGEYGIASAAFKLKSQPAAGNLEYRTYQREAGWDTSADGTWKKNGETSGISGINGGGIQAIEMRLTGALKDQYDLYYQVYIVDYGWLGWAVNGGTAGVQTSGSGKAVGEIGAVHIQLRPKNSAYGSPGDGESPILGIALPDRTGLWAAADDAGTVLDGNESEYSIASWQALAEAYLKAQEVLENYVQAGQDALDEVESSLRSALDSLVRAPDVSGLAEKTALKETRYPNNDETAALYTKESWETLQRAYDDAKVILENYRDGYTQAEADAAEAALAASMEQMQPAQEEIPKPKASPSPEESPEPENSVTPEESPEQMPDPVPEETETVFGEQEPVLTEPQTE